MRKLVTLAITVAVASSLSGCFWGPPPGGGPGGPGGPGGGQGGPGGGGPGGPGDGPGPHGAIVVPHVDRAV
ncbi:hypothetical protein G3N59_09130 [Paraburkholderia sp. Ac-20340]|nr:hypothetical protein [Paraburkholderia sp. Ac-20340]